MVKPFVALVVASTLGSSCQAQKTTDERLDFAASFLSANFDNISKSTKSGQPCYPLIDGSITYKVQRLGVFVASKWEELKTEFNYTVIVFKVHDTPSGKRFDELATKMNSWESADYKRAIEYCESCSSQDDPLTSRCRLP
jgi:hypothetical protein